MKAKKFIVALSVLAAAALSASAVGCNLTGSPNNNGADTGDNGGTGTNEDGGNTSVVEMTFDDLVQNRQTAAKEFFETYLRSTLTQGQETQAESWYLTAADDGLKVASAAMSYIYNVDDTTRALQIAQVDFSPISAQDVADGDVTDISVTNSSTETIFEFDAKENYNNQDVAAALYSATVTTSPVKLYAENQTETNLRSFDLLKLSDNAITVTNITVTKGDGSKDTLLENLSNRAKYTYRTASTTTLDGVKINELTYALEDLGGDDTQEEPENPDLPIEDDEEEQHEATAAEIIQALDENCKAGVLNAYDPFGVNENYVKDGQWFVTQNEDGKITKAEYLFRYQKTEKDSYFIVSTVEFDTPLDINNINNATIQNATYTKTFSTANYNPTIQADNADFTNAMCDKIFGEKTNAMRFIVNKGYSVDSVLKSEANGFILIEVSDNEIKQTQISIKESSSNEEYVAKLDDQSNYRIVTSSEYTISGEKLEA